MEAPAKKYNGAPAMPPASTSPHYQMPPQQQPLQPPIQSVTIVPAASTVVAVTPTVSAATPVVSAMPEPKALVVDATPIVSAASGLVVHQVVEPNQYAGQPHRQREDGYGHGGYTAGYHKSSMESLQGGKDMQRSARHF